MIHSMQRFFGRPPIWPYYEPRPISWRILDNLGLTINVAMMDAWPGYIRARDRYFGKGRLAQWFMYRIYRRLFPGRQSDLKGEWIKERTAMQQEFVQAVIDRGEREAGERPRCGELTLSKLANLLPDC